MQDWFGVFLALILPNFPWKHFEFNSPICNLQNSSIPLNPKFKLKLHARLWNSYRGLLFQQWNCMQGDVTACKLVKLHASLCNCMYVFHNNLLLTIAVKDYLLTQIHDFWPIGLFVTYILFLNVPPGPHKKMLKVIASSGIAGLSALANVVDGLPDLVGTHPPGKAVDGGPQLSHRGGGMTP